MFRPARRRSWLGDVVVRLAASVFGLSAVLLAIAFVAGMRYGRDGSVAAERGGGTSWSLMWRAVGGLAAGDALKALAAVLVLVAVGILFVTTVLHYRAITHTFERVKSLMRNVLQSIPTGVLTFDARGVITSLNSAAERLLGLRASAVVGRQIEDVLKTVNDILDWKRRENRTERQLK